MLHHCQFLRQHDDIAIVPPVIFPVSSCRVDAIATKVEELSEASLMMQTSSKASASTQAKLPPVLDERITYIEEQVTFSPPPPSILAYFH